MFVNIHSHHHALKNDQWVIQNLYDNFTAVNNIGNYSIGLHPWYIKKTTWQGEWKMLQNFADNSSVIAIGECGLDRNCTTDFLLQAEVFSAHVQLANKLSKPIIIHCVNAYDDIIKILKKLKNNVPVIFHGFNKKEKVAFFIIQEGFYISLGKSLSQENAKSLLKNIPLTNIFFETDNDSITIEEIYTMAAKILNINTETLQLQIKKNAVKLFGEGLF